MFSQYPPLIRRNPDSLDFVALSFGRGMPFVPGFGLHPEQNGGFSHACKYAFQHVNSFSSVIWVEVGAGLVAVGLGVSEGGKGVKVRVISGLLVCVAVGICVSVGVFVGRAVRVAVAVAVGVGNKIPLQKNPNTAHITNRNVKTIVRTPHVNVTPAK